MKKGLIIKLAIVLVVLILSYCVFWFFKAGQSEKQINKFIADNSTYVSAGEISVSGFPINQKIIINDLKITLPVNMIAKRQLHVKKLEASASIFSTSFKVNFADAVKVQDMDSSGDIFDVEFASQPEIIITLANGIISQFKYNDSGFKVFDAEKNIVNSSTGATIGFETSIDETETKISKINASLKELEGYTLIDFYKNILEKKVIEGIKTEEIKVNASIQPVIDPNQIITNLPQPVNQAIDTASLANKQASSDGQAPVLAPVPAPANVPVPIPSEAVKPSNTPTQIPAQNGEEAVKQAMAMAQQLEGQNQQVGSQNAQQPVNPAPDTISDTSIVKSNLLIDVTITLTPTIKSEPAEPSDPTQIQELPVQFVQNIKIDNFEFSNPLYKINISGNAVNSSDDNFPSGGITIKVEKIANLVEQLKKQFKDLSESKKSLPVPNGADTSVEQSQSGNPVNYDLFLSNISERIVNVTNDIASKNSVTKDDVAQFDVRREKNLEFLVNEVSVREIIGKF